MDKYTRVEASKPEETSTINKNEIRVTTQGKMRKYISYATSLLNENSDTITLKAMGKAINKTVAIAEIIKRRIPGLHQITEIDSTNINEKYVPIEEGLDPIETTRHVSSILISLFKNTPDTHAIGYQAPLPKEEVKNPPPNPRPRNKRGPRNNRRGGRTGQPGSPQHTSEPASPQQTQQIQSEPREGQPQNSAFGGRRGQRRGGRRGGRGRGRLGGRGRTGYNQGFGQEGGNQGYPERTNYGGNRYYGGSQGYPERTNYGGSQGYPERTNYGENQGQGQRNQGYRNYQNQGYGNQGYQQGNQGSQGYPERTNYGDNQGQGYPNRGGYNNRGRGGYNNRGRGRTNQ